MAKRELVPTLLVVGEGDSEEAFLRHIRQFPLCRRNVTGPKLRSEMRMARVPHMLSIMQFVFQRILIMMLSLFFLIRIQTGTILLEKRLRNTS